VGVQRRPADRADTHIIVLDTEAQEAAWFSLAGAEIVDLSAPLQRPVPELTAFPAWLGPNIRDPDPTRA
jgi:hypothetical protein